MPSEGQSGLSDFAETDGRPTAEAEAVAGVDEVTGSSQAAVDADDEVDLAVMTVDYALETDETGEEVPVVHAFCRRDDGTPEHVRVVGFRPYFYVPDEEVPELLDDDRVTGTDDGYRAIDDTDVTRIYAQTPRDVGQMREGFSHYEADVRFPNRLLIDRGIKTGMRVPERRRDDDTIEVTPEEIDPVDIHVSPRVFFFDIEVDDRRGFPEDGEEPIISIAAHDSGTDRYIAWLYVAPDGDGTTPESIDGFDPIVDDTAVEVRAFEAEDAMLDDFLEYVEASAIDVFSGWNLDDFDAPYLLDRLERLDGASSYDLSIERLSRVDEVWRSNFGGPDIKGRVVFDLLYAYRRTQFTELDSYRLDDVGEEELGIGKERYPGSIGDLWEDDPERLLEYNVRDVELCVELDKKQEVIAFWNEVRSLVGCQLEDAPTPGDTVDMYILHKVHGDFVLPSRGRQQGEEYEGGAVFEPITGIRENVSVLDLKSLYPMCMRTMNASPETKVDPTEYDGPTYRAPNDIHFRKDPPGIVREMVDELLNEREQKKGRRDEHDPQSEAYDLYDRQQGAVKVLMNCFTPDTDVVTPNGIVKITELGVGDQVYSIDPETMTVELKPIVETHEYPDYQGELVDIQSSLVDFRLTPNHRMVVRQNDKNGITEDQWGFKEVRELHDYCRYELPWGWSFNHGDELEQVDLTEYTDEYEVWVRPDCHGRTFTTELGFRPPLVMKADLGVQGYVLQPDAFEEHREYIDSVAAVTLIHTTPNRKWIPRTHAGDDFIELLAWYITEGNVYTSEDKYFGEQFRGSATTVHLSQDKAARTDGGAGYQSIGALLDRMDIDYYVDEKGYQFTSKLLGNILESICGQGSVSKRIPEFIFSLSKRQKELFFDRLIDGDGNIRENTWRYSTNSIDLRDGVVRLAVELGYTPRVRFDSGVWRVLSTENQKNSISPSRYASESTADDGVYCVTVADNHTLLAGRNGRFQFIGQSLYGTLGWTRFRLYDKDMGAAVTATGRATIEHTAEVAEEQGKEVVYGDSITGDRPVVVRSPTGNITIIPIEELFAAATEHAPRLLVDGGDRGGTWKDRRQLDGWDALSLSSDGEPQWRSIREIIRHKTDKPVVKLQHEIGESTTTRDHSYVVEDAGELIEAAPSEVDEPLRIPGMPTPETVSQIDLYEELSGETRSVEADQGGQDDIADTTAKEIHADEAFVWVGQEHQRDQRKITRLKRYIDLNGPDGKALLRLLGAYLSNGSTPITETMDGRIGASIAESDQSQLETLKEDYERLFGHSEVSVHERDSCPRDITSNGGSNASATALYTGQTLNLQMMDELAGMFFRELAGQTAQCKQIPWFVYQLEPHQQDVFLETLIEGDGTSDVHNDPVDFLERDFKFESTSPTLIGGLSMLLTSRGRRHSFKYREETEHYMIRTVDGSSDGSDPILHETAHDGYVYDLSVDGNHNFVDAVGGIVLHNTDSVMMELGGDVEQNAAIEASFDLEERLNNSYDEFALETLNAETHYLEIEFEKLYRRFFQAGKKKRYAGHIVWKEGKTVDDIDITGFEYQRSDIAPITKEVQHEVLERIVREGDIESVKTYLHDIITRFEDGEFDAEEIGIPGGIGKRLDNYETDTAQVRGAKYANMLLGTNLNRGAKPKRLYLEKVHPDFFADLEERGEIDPDNLLYQEFKKDPDVICFEYEDQLPDAFRIDYDKMLDKTLKGPIERILEALDITWDEVRAGQTQTGLGRF